MEKLTSGDFLGENPLIGVLGNELFSANRVKTGHMG